MDLNLSEQVEKFNNKIAYCPMDGGKIPVVFKEKDSKDTKFIFSWCHYCGLAFGYIAKIDNSYQLIASFYWDDHLCEVGVWTQYLGNCFDSKYPISSKDNDLSTLVNSAFGVKDLEISREDILRLKLFADKVFIFLNAN
jgi:hypothetical protein